MACNYEPAVYTEVIVTSPEQSTSSDATSYCKRTDGDGGCGDGDDVIVSDATSPLSDRTDVDEPLYFKDFWPQRLDIKEQRRNNSVFETFE